MEIHELNTKGITSPAYVALDDGSDTYKLDLYAKFSAINTEFTLLELADETTAHIWYGYTTTASGIATKAVSLQFGGTFEPKTGDYIVVAFSQANTASTMSLSVASGDAVSVIFTGSTGADIPKGYHIFHITVSNGAPYQYHYVGIHATATNTIRGLMSATDKSNLDTAVSNIGTLANLTTTEKGSLVGAINELDADNTNLNNDISASIDAIYDGVKKFENVSVIEGAAVNQSTGGVASFPTYTTWAVSELYAIPKNTIKIESNFNQGVGYSSSFGFAIYSSEDTNHSYVVGGQDLSALTMQDNYKFIRMTNYNANADHSGLYVSFVLDSSLNDITSTYPISVGMMPDIYGTAGTKYKKIEIKNNGSSSVSSLSLISTNKNLLMKGFNSTTTINGITFTLNADSSVTANGTATANAYVVYGQLFSPKSYTGKFKLSGCPKNGGSTRYRMYLAASGFAVYDYGEGVEFEATAQSPQCVLFVPSGMTVANITFKPLVTHNSTDIDFVAPDTNITVISATISAGKTLVIEESGKMFIDGEQVGSTGTYLLKDTNAHIYAYNTSQPLETTVYYYGLPQNINGRVISLESCFDTYSNMNGKKIVTYGDSLTWYDGQAFTWGALQGTYCYGFQTYLRNELKMDTTNRGQSGQTTPQICARIEQATDLASYDYLSMMSGDNDDRLDVSIGTLQPVGSTFDKTTVIGALQSAIEYALGENPKLKIILMSEPMGWTYQSGALDRVSELIPNAYKQVSEQYGLPFIDLYHESGINEITRETYLLDPSSGNTDYMYHPNNDGWARIGNIICSKLPLY